MNKTQLKVHMIFVVKYRKPLLVPLGDYILTLFAKISKSSLFTIDIAEVDKDHIHMIILYPPNISITSIVRKLKQESTVCLWNNFEVFLRKHFWKEHTFWSDGYFAYSIGQASEEIVRKYIENQGN